MNWRVGQRVCREDNTAQLGTVAEVEPKAIKIEWDGGRTSYYVLVRHVPLKDVPQREIAVTVLDRTPE